MLNPSYISILKIAIPMMLGMFVQSIVMITDAAILNHYDTLSYDASGNAGLVYVTLFMGMSGLGDASQILISNRIGDKKIEAVKYIVPSSILSNLCLGLIFFLFLQFVMPAALLSYSKSEALALEQIEFLSIRSLGFFFGALMLSLNAYFLSLGKTWVIMIGSIIFAISNIGLDLLLVFGTDSIPAMGIKGAATASVIGEAIASIYLLIVLFKSKEHQIYKVFSVLKVRWDSIKQLWKIGTPLVLQGFLALATWTAFFTWIEQRGLYDLTVSQNIRNIYMLAFVPIFGFAATTKTYVSNYMGSRNFEGIKLVQKRIIILVILFTLLVFHGALLYPEALISIVNSKEEYLPESARILRMVFGSIVMFGIFTPFFQTINGSGNTRVTLIIEISSIIVYLICAYLFVKVWNFEIFNVWFVEYIYFGSLSILSIGYLKFFNWQQKVI